MNLYIKDSNYTTIGVAESYTSLIWTKRYQEAGDFELYLPANEAQMDLYKIGNYVLRDDDETVMMIEKVEISSDTEQGDFLIVTGRSLEALLARRIVWNQATVTGTPETRIRTLVDICCITTTDARKISKLSLGTKQGYSGNVDTTQYTGDNLYDAIVDIAKASGLGFKITADDDGNMVFDVYKSIDYSYDQSTNPYIVFSPNFDNLLNSDYYTDGQTYGTIAMTLGEGEGTARKGVIVGDNSLTGINRHELYVDARDLSQNLGEDDEISDEDYEKMLTARGREQLSESAIISAFSAEIATSSTYKYKEDYLVGDIVQIENQYGYKLAVRIDALTENWDSNGYGISPTLTEYTLEDEEETLVDSEGYRIEDKTYSYVDTTDTIDKKVLTHKAEEIDEAIDKIDEINVYDGKLTLTQGNSVLGTFTANQQGDITINIPKTDLSAYYTSSQVDDLLDDKADTSSLSKVATSGSYNDLSDKPTITDYEGGTTDYGTISVKNGTITLSDAVGLETEKGGEIFNDSSNEAYSLAHAEGRGTKAYGLYSHSECDLNSAYGESSHAEGENTVAGVAYTVVTSESEMADTSKVYRIGNFYYTYNESTSKWKKSSYNPSNSPHSEGIYTTATGDGSHAEGYHTTASSDYQHTQGKWNVDDADDTYADIVGGGSSSSLSNIYTLDWNGNINCGKTDSTGAWTSYGTFNGIDVVTLYNDHTTLYNDYTAHLDEEVGKKYKVGSVNKGEIFNSYSGDGVNVASGELSHAEGYKTTASGTQAHAEGGGTTASGQMAHAEGESTVASGELSHAEGYSTTASKQASHAEGYGATASGKNAHAEGYYTASKGENSHAEGYHTTASSNNQHAQGKWNVDDADSTYADIVGNGTGSNSKSNIYTLDWNGNIWCGKTDSSGNWISYGKINGVDITALPTTDANVTQTEVSTNESYELLFAGSTGTDTKTEGVGKSSGLTYNPSTKKLTGNLSGNADTATLATNAEAVKSSSVWINARGTVWQKFATCNITAANSDYHLVVHVTDGWGRTSGILHARCRTESNYKTLNTNATYLIWECLSDNQTDTNYIPSLFKMVYVYDETNNKGVAELWCKQIGNYHAWRFSVLDEGLRATFSNIWTMLNYADSDYQTSDPTGTQVFTSFQQSNSNSLLGTLPNYTGADLSRNIATGAFVCRLSGDSTTFTTPYMSVGSSDTYKYGEIVCGWTTGNLSRIPFMLGINSQIGTTSNHIVSSNENHTGTTISVSSEWENSTTKQRIRLTFTFGTAMYGGIRVVYYG